MITTYNKAPYGIYFGYRGGLGGDLRGVDVGNARIAVMPEIERIVEPATAVRGHVDAERGDFKMLAWEEGCGGVGGEADFLICFTEESIAGSVVLDECLGRDNLQRAIVFVGGVVNGRFMENGVEKRERDEEEGNGNLEERLFASKATDYKEGEGYYGEKG